MQIIVVIREGADRYGFKAFLQQKGLAFTEFEFLPRLFEVEVGDSPSEVMIHPDAENYDESDNPGRHASTFLTRTSQPLAIAALLNPPPGLIPAGDIVDSSAYTDNWALHRIARRSGALNSLPATSSFNCYRSGVGVDVYVIDSGVDSTHPDLTGRATQVFSTVSGSNVDDFGHGTDCASLAAGTKFGAAKDALIWGFKMLDSTGAGTASAFTSAANQLLSHYQGRAATNRPAVVNISLTFFGSDVTGTIVASLIAAGIVVCAAAGNAGVDMTVSGQQTFPATNANVICVGGSTISDAFYAVVDFQGGGSNWGSRVDVLAPSYQTRGAVVEGTNNNPPGMCGTWSGTSMGTGVTTGVVACMLQGYARLTSTAQVQSVRSYVMSQATTLTIPNMAARWPNTTTKLLYLDPSPTPSLIPGLTQMATPDPNGYSSKGITPVIGLAVPAPSVSHEVPQPPGIIYPKAIGSAGCRALVVS